MRLPSLTSCLSPLRRILNAFLSERRGSVTVETMLILPPLIWAYLGIYVFFDAFSTITTASKANYTISDALSRQRQEVDTQFLESSHDLFQWLVASDRTAIRISSITWSDADDAYRVAWSYSTTGQTSQTNGTIGAFESQIPILPDGDHLIVVETWLDYTPLWSMGLGPFTFRDFTVTRPRFMPKLEFVI